jgi:hypothetical protein
LYAAGAGLELIPFAGAFGDGAGAINAMRAGWSYTKNTFGKVSGVAGDAFRGAKSYFADKLTTLSGYKRVGFDRSIGLSKEAGQWVHGGVKYLWNSAFEVYNFDRSLWQNLYTPISQGVYYYYLHPRYTET